ncbi:2-dehydro-3-deoxygluconokinase [Pseudomonas sp. PA15(2017)]|uniref:sugar kinase n=1 Tax=Pseudomonas sp. PA15(2017) TaxID=1932111 RepID=UPI00095EEA89|nr:sugar kinase [Pseudomonas sp. PA15(2017)]OLU33099.1 2-dehydro-3-deoxygluconokinase [Pseudomonas sp. PA15(2017)]
MAEFDILAFGETMAMFVAETPGDLASVEQFGKRIAGADNNVAIGLSRLGFNVAWLSRVGDDSFGRFVRASLQAEGIDCTRLKVDPLHPTGFQLKARASDGTDPVVEYFRRGSAASHLNIDEDYDVTLLSARHLHATGIPPALSSSARAFSRHLLEAMRGAGRSISFDPNLRPSLWDSERQMRQELNELSALAHWVMPGLAEGQLLTGYRTAPDIAAFYLERGVQVVAIKLGPRGSYWRTVDAEGLVPGIAVAEVIDTVGAGDGFATGFVSALLEGLDVAAAVARGNWIGARAVQVVGDMEGMPQRCELP